MKNITVLISSFLGRGQWRTLLVALAVLFFAAGCTVELYPPAQEVSNLPDGGKVDVLPDTIPRAFSFGPRMYWSQIVGSDSTYSFAVTGANKTGRWLDSIRWVPSGPFVTVNGDTLSTRAYARDNSGGTDDQTLTYNGSGSLTIEDGNTVDMSDLLDNTDNQTIDTLTLQGDTMLQVSLSGDGAPVKELDLSALRSVIDSTRLTQDSILVYYQDGAEVGRDTISGTGGGGGGTDDQTLTYNGSGSLTIEDGNTVDMSDLLDNTDDQTIDTFSLSGNTFSISLESDGEAAKTVDLSGYLDNTDAQTLSFSLPNLSISGGNSVDLSALERKDTLVQDSILVYYQGGIEIGRDTISGTGGGGGGTADNLGNHIMTQNLQTNGNWISGDGGNEGIGVDAAGKFGVGTLTPSYALDINSTDAVRVPIGTTAQQPTGANGLIRYNSDSTAFTAYYNAQWNRLIDYDFLYSSAGRVAANYWTKTGVGLSYPFADIIGINTSVAPNYFGNDPTLDADSPIIHMSSGFGDSPGLAFSYGSNTNALISYSNIVNTMYNSIKGTSGRYFFYIDTNPKFTITNTAVSIGTTTPDTYKALGQSNYENLTIFGSGIKGTGLIMKNGYNDGIDIWTMSSFFGGTIHASYFDTYVANSTTKHYTRHVNKDTEVATIIEQFDIDDLVFFPASAGRVGIQTTTPTAKLHLPAGTAAANTAPLKFTAGTNLTTPEAGAMEWDGTNLYVTQTTGPTRKTIAYVDTDDGSASDTTDGSGDITVSHTLGSASITVTATATGTTFYHVQVHSKTSTTFKIRFYNSPGSAATSTAVTADWIAKLQ